MSKNIIELKVPYDLCSYALELAERDLFSAFGFPAKTLIASNITDAEIKAIFEEVDQDLEYEISKLLPCDSWILFDTKGHGIFSTGA